MRRYLTPDKLPTVAAVAVIVLVAAWAFYRLVLYHPTYSQADIDKIVLTCIHFGGRQSFCKCLAQETKYGVDYQEFLRMREAYNSGEVSTVSSRVLVKSAAAGARCSSQVIKDIRLDPQSLPLPLPARPDAKNAKPVPPSSLPGA